MSNSLNKKNEVAEFLKSDYLTEPTSKVLLERLNEEFKDPKFFNRDQYELLGTISQILMGEDSDQYNNKVAGAIDRRLFLKEGNGWRFDQLPPDQEMYTLGLKGIEETSFDFYDQSFKTLNHEQQTEILTTIQNGSPAGNTWYSLSAKMFFTELLAEIAETYYSLPEIQLEMGYAGMADNQGWTQIKMNESEEVENLVKKVFQEKRSHE